jgi:hypothetical protein
MAKIKIDAEIIKAIDSNLRRVRRASETVAIRRLLELIPKGYNLEVKVEGRRAIKSGYRTHHQEYYEIPAYTDLRYQSSRGIISAKVRTPDTLSNPDGTSGEYDLEHLSALSKRLRRNKIGTDEVYRALVKEVNRRFSR